MAGQLLSGNGYSIIEEQLPEDTFAKFRTDPVSHCADLQEQIMVARLQQWRTVGSCEKIAFDRSVDEDISVFCELHRLNGLLSDRDFLRLKKTHSDIRAEMPGPDLILFFSAPINTLRGRMERSGHPKKLLDSIGTQCDLYQRWVSDRAESVLRIDNTDCVLRPLKHFFEGLR